MQIIKFYPKKKKKKKKKKSIWAHAYIDKRILHFELDFYVVQKYL